MKSFNKKCLALKGHLISIKYRFPIFTSSSSYSKFFSVKVKIPSGVEPRYGYLFDTSRPIVCTTTS